MHQIIIAAAVVAAQQNPSGGKTDEVIIVTASRDPVALQSAPVSAAVFDSQQLRALGFPLVSDTLRLAPGVAVSSTGPKGTQSQVRIRGAEAGHTLLFVDGIKFNDPAAGNEARFELLTSDALSRIEVVRGPQSALWGSEALGGVIAIDTANPLAMQGINALAEYGSLDSGRASAQFATKLGGLGLSGSGGWLRSDGIDSFGTGGERDGYENHSASLKAVFSPLASSELGLAGHWIQGDSEFDGTDPLSYLRSDTLDSTVNEILALRAWGSTAFDGWSLLVDGSILDSENRNKLADQARNSSFGKRVSFNAQLSRDFTLVEALHRLTVAVEREKEDFSTLGQAVFGVADQRRSRKQTAFIGQWRASWSSNFITDIAVRNDRFSDFADATTLRAAALFKPLDSLTGHIAYGEGLAQPTFYDLYGFDPNLFAGNPNLRPETSKGWEIGLRWYGKIIETGINAFTHRLTDEIVDVFDAATFLFGTENAVGKSHRRGVEIEGMYRFSQAASLALNYTYLDAEDRKALNAAPIREVRRPRHSANATLTGQAGAFNWGASLSYVGERHDTDYDIFQDVTLDDYLLASLRFAYRITERIEAFGRIENGFDADYQDVAGYNTPGRTVYAGLRLRLGG